MKGSRASQSPERGRFAIPGIVDGGRRENRSHSSAALVRSVHPEDVTHRRHTKLVLMAQIEAVQTIDQLGTIRHRDLLWVTVEDVQRHPTENRIAQCGYLFQLISRCSFAARSIPGAPFVDHELYGV